MRYGIATTTRRDTAQWVFQTWASFGVSLVATVVGAWNLPAGSLDMAFVFLGAGFTLFAALVLSKHLRDNQHESVDTPSYRFAVWAGFMMSTSLTAWGVWRVAANDWHKGFVALALIFLLSSAFPLAKTLRDKHEADKAEKRAADMGAPK